MTAVLPMMVSEFPFKLKRKIFKRNLKKKQWLNNDTNFRWLLNDKIKIKVKIKQNKIKRGKKFVRV